MARSKFQGFAERGNLSVLTALSGTIAKAQRSCPNAPITVYNTGTLTPATIYSNEAGAAKSSSFTADSSGYWFFYGDSTTYDIQITCNGTFTLSDYSGAGVGQESLPWFFADDPTYGLILDGVADDTVAFSTLLDLVIAAHGTLIVPADAVIRLTANKTITGSNWKIVGAGGGKNDQATIIVDGNITGLTLGSAGNIVELVTIVGITFQGANGGVNHRGVNLTYAKNCHFEDCHWTLFTANAATGAPVWASGGGATSTFGNDFLRCWWTFNTGYSVYMLKGGCAGNKFRDCFWGANTIGTALGSVYLNGFTDWTAFEGLCDFEDTTDTAANAAIFFTAVWGLRIVGAHFETESALWFDATADVCYNAEIEGNWFYSANPAKVIKGNGLALPASIRNNQFDIVSGTQYDLTNAIGGVLRESNRYLTTARAGTVSGVNIDRDRDVGLTSPAFDAADYSSDSGTLVLTNPDVTTYSYEIANGIMTVWYRFDTATVTGAPTFLRIDIPGGFTSANETWEAARTVDAGGTAVLSTAQTLAGGAYIYILRELAATAWTANSNGTGARGKISFPISV